MVLHTGALKVFLLKFYILPFGRHKPWSHSMYTSLSCCCISILQQRHQILRPSNLLRGIRSCLMLFQNEYWFHIHTFTLANMYYSSSIHCHICLSQTYKLTILTHGNHCTGLSNEERVNFVRPKRNRYFKNAEKKTAQKFETVKD